MTKLTVKLLEEESKSRSNVTLFEILIIIYFNVNVKDVLGSLSSLTARIIKLKKLETNEEVKFTIKMLWIICTSTATQTFQEGRKTARRMVYEEYIDEEYDIKEVQENIIIEDEE